MRASALLIGAILLVALLATTFAGVPNTTNYQGWLTDDAGDPVTDNLLMIFYIWDDASAGSILWAEEHLSVSVESGFFNVVLGSNDPIPDSAFYGTDRWLEIVVDGNTISPRTKLQSTPYSFITKGVSGHITTEPGHIITASDAAKAGTEVDIHAADGIARIAMQSSSEPDAHTMEMFVSDSLGGQFTWNYGAQTTANLTSNATGVNLSLHGVSPGSGWTASETATIIGEEANDFVLVSGYADTGVPSIIACHSGPTHSSIQLTAPKGDNPPTIYMEVTTAKAKVGIGVENPTEALVIGKDMGNHNGEMVVIGNDTPGSQSGIKFGEDDDNCGRWFWNNDSNYVFLITRVDGVSYNPLYIRQDDVGIQEENPSYPLDVNGDIQCVTLHETSDIRLKDKVKPLENAMSLLTQLEGVSFEWNALAESHGSTAGKKDIGVIADDVEKVLPELVYTDNEGYKSVAYTKLVAVLIEALKEQQTEIDELRQILEANLQAKSQQ
jgi:hypothetical protein